MFDHDLISIPAGDYWMGETPDDKFANDTERPRHHVQIPAFRLGRFPVTVAAYQEFRPGHAANLPGDIPATGVTWQDAVAYCDWRGAITGLDLRLPTESEWEYAARAGTATLYSWGDEIAASLANYRYAEDTSRVGPGHPTPVGAYPANPFGLYDLLGNVAEWTQDIWHPDYLQAPTDGSAWVALDATPRDRVLRGGAWDYLPRLLRSSWRDSYPEDCYRDNLGFRVAASID